MANIEQLPDNCTAFEMVEKIQELISVYNSDQTDTEGIRDIVEFGTNVLAETLNCKIWCFSSNSEMIGNTKLVVNDIVLVIQMGGEFNFWKILPRGSSEIPKGATTLDVSNPILVAVKMSYGYLASSQIQMSDSEFEKKLNEVMGVQPTGTSSYDFDSIIKGLAVQVSNVMITDEELEV